MKLLVFAGSIFCQSKNFPVDTCV